MGRWAMELNPRIREILVAAQLEHGMSAAETARAAQAGELEGLPPTRVSETTCRDLAAEAGREQEPGRRPAPVDAIAARAQAILEREMARLEEKSKHGLKSPDATALRRLVQVAREIKAMQLGFAPRGRAPRNCSRSMGTGRAEIAHPRPRAG